MLDNLHSATMRIWRTYNADSQIGLNPLKLTSSLAKHGPDCSFSLTHLCNPSTHLSTSDDRYIFNNNISDSWRREASDDLRSCESHVDRCPLGSKVKDTLISAQEPPSWTSEIRLQRRHLAPGSDCGFQKFDVKFLCVCWLFFLNKKRNAKPKQQLIHFTSL